MSGLRRKPEEELQLSLALMVYSYATFAQVIMPVQYALQSYPTSRNHVRLHGGLEQTFRCHRTYSDENRGRNCPPICSVVLR